METDGHLHFSKRRNRVSLLRIQVLGLLFLLFGSLISLNAFGAESVEKKVFRYLTDDADLSPAAACGIMGNIKAESNFNPACVGMGRAYGLCQWTGVRTSRLRSYCNTHKLSSSSAEGQAAFLCYELKTYFPKVFAYLESVPNTAAGAYQAGAYFCIHFEAPANARWASGYRGNIARNTYWPAYGLTALYVRATSRGRYIKLNWTGKWSGKLAVMRSEKRSGKYKEIARLDKKVYSYTDKAVKKKKTYYYYLLPVSGKKKLTDDRSNKVSGMCIRSMQDEDCTMKLSKTEYTYNGKERKPSVTVWYKGKKLKKNKDYRLDYNNNTNAGNAYVKVYGRGSYAGSRKLKFKIKKAEYKVRIRNITTAYSKEKLQPEFSVKGLKQKQLKYRFKCTDKSVAKGSGKKIRLLRTGKTIVTLHLAKSKNYRAAAVTFTLTVKPAAPKFTRAVRKGKTLILKWKGKGKPDGYEIMYTSAKKFKENAPVLLIEDRRQKKVRLQVDSAKKTWQVRIRSYTMTEDGSKLFSKWSKTAVIKK